MTASAVSDGDAGRPSRQNLLVGVLLLFAALMMYRALFDQIETNSSLADKACSLAGPHIGVACAGGPVYAPQAYRVLMPAIFGALSHRLPSVDPIRVVVAVDTLFFFMAFLLLYRVMVRQARSIGYGSWSAIAFALAMMAPPFYWTFPLYRSETSVTTLFVAFALWCFEAVEAQGLLTLLLLAAGLVQSFARTDGVIALGTGIFLCALLPVGRSVPGGRRLAMLRGALLVAIAIGVQAYLQFVRFPGLHYEPGTPMIMLWNNLRPHFGSQALMAIGPLAVVSFLAWRSRFHLRGTDALIAAATMVEIPLWLVLGSGAEARIVVPFLFACCPLAGRMALAVAMDRRDVVPEA